MSGVQDKSRITRQRHGVPDFALYGVAPAATFVDLVHYERIPLRSGLFDFNIEPHFHGALLQVLYPTAGGGETFIDGKTWAVKPPCLIVAPARSVHGFRFSRDIDGHVVTAAQSPLESLAMATAPDLLAAIRKPTVLELDAEGRHGAVVAPLFEAIGREAAKPQRWQSTAGMALLLALFVEIARIAEGAERFESPARSRLATRIERFRALLDAHCRERLSVEHYARAMRVTSGQLTRIARQGLGMSALTAIDARAVHEAKRELAYSNLSVKQIAAELGFRDEAYFGRFFRKQTGLRPTEFREQSHRRFDRVGAEGCS